MDRELNDILCTKECPKWDTCPYAPDYCQDVTNKVKKINSITGFNTILEVAKEFNTTPKKIMPQIKEAFTVLNTLVKYSMIHTVKGVIYPEGSHEDYIKRANNLLSKLNDGK